MFSANSPWMIFGNSLDKLGNVAPHCPALSGWSGVDWAASSYIANS